MQATRSPSSRAYTAAAWLLGITVVAGIVLRLHSSSDLWLDEALTVNISKLPVGDLLRHLKHDGHPPLYYLLLHVWMRWFGSGDNAVRSLSTIFSILTIPPLVLIARRLGGKAMATATLVLVVTSPFAIRYATETRMYALEMLLVTLGWLAVHWAMERPTLGRLVPVSIVSGLLALAHYWSLYLLAALGIMLLIKWRRGDPAALRVAIALFAGGVLFLPWLPSFLYQAKHTGTPWGTPDRPTTVVATMFTDWGGGPNGEAQFLGVGLFLLMGLAVTGRGLDTWRVELDLRTRVGVRTEAAMVALTLVLAMAVAYLTQSAFAARYTAVLVPLGLLIAAWGVKVFLDPRMRAVVLVLIALFGLVNGIRVDRTERTQAGMIARYISVQGDPGDVVAFCPDQLGPATMRLLAPGRFAYSFPDASDPHFVDWVDYKKRNQAGKPQSFAQMLHDKAGAHTVWIVEQPGYRTYGTKCEKLVDDEKELRSGAAVVESGGQFEHMFLYQFGPGHLKQ
jgi:uncharacterized membrane protein